MSGKRYCNPATDLNKFDKRLSHCKEGVDQTCPVQGPDMSEKCYCNSTMDPNKSGKRLSRCEEGLTGHVQSRSQTCLVNFTGTRQWTRISSED
jgi:hypothetical protein